MLNGRASRICVVCGMPMPAAKNFKTCSDECRQQHRENQNKIRNAKIKLNKEKKERGHNNRLTIAEMGKMAKSLGISYGELSIRLETGTLNI